MKQFGRSNPKRFQSENDSRGHDLNPWLSLAMMVYKGACDDYMRRKAVDIGMIDKGKIWNHGLGYKDTWDAEEFIRNNPYLIMPGDAILKKLDEMVMDGMLAIPDPRADLDKRQFYIQKKKKGKKR